MWAGTCSPGKISEDIEKLPNKEKERAFAILEAFLQNK